jgi:ribosome biogenesis protein SSF1/2
LIDFRHYRIKTVASGINKKLKRILTGKKLPNLKNYEDIGDYILGQQATDMVSESEFEELPDSHIELEQSVSKRKQATKTRQASIRLYEVGPRMKLRLVKIEEGLLGGNVIYHRVMRKTVHEVQTTKQKLKEKEKLKNERRKKMQDIINEKMQKQLEKKRARDERRASKIEEEAQEEEEDGEEDEEDVEPEDDEDEEEDM